MGSRKKQQQPTGDKSAWKSILSTPTTKDRKVCKGEMFGTLYGMFSAKIVKKRTAAEAAEELNEPKPKLSRDVPKCLLSDPPARANCETSKCLEISTSFPALNF
jgi:hypothetical protein